MAATGRRRASTGDHTISDSRKKCHLTTKASKVKKRKHLPQLPFDDDERSPLLSQQQRERYRCIGDGRTAHSGRQRCHTGSIDITDGTLATRSLGIMPPVCSVPDDIANVDTNEQHLASQLHVSMSASAKVKPESNQQRLIMVLLVLLHFSAFTCYSLIAPFFPNVMLEKGGTATLAAWVLASYNLITLIVSPIFGRLVTIIGSKTMLVGGVLTLSCSSLMFGCLNWCPAGWLFITLSFVIRIIEGTGMASYLTASFSIVANAFPGSTGFVMGLLETSLGLGLTMGPLIGGVLYQFGGFYFPFFFFGGFLFVIVTIVCFLLPTQPDQVAVKNAGFFKLLVIPYVALDALAIASSAFAIGFFEAGIALHIGPSVNNNAIYIGLIVLCTGMFQGLSAPLWGKLIDRNIASPKYLCAIGCCFTAVAWLFIGPIWFMPLPTIYWVTMGAVVIMGIGNGCLLTIPFPDALAGAILGGYPNNFDTFGYVSALFTSTFALGAFVGPMVAGPLVEALGFRVASSLVLLVQVIIGISQLAYEMCHRRRRSSCSSPSLSSADALSNSGSDNNSALHGA